MSEPAKTNPGALRKAIDSGETADKVDHRDPAAAPLGTHDEASGHPNSPRQVERAMTNEIAPADTAPPDESIDEQVRDDPRKFLVFVGLVAVAVAIVTLVAVF